MEALEIKDNEIISTKECKEILGQELSDERILSIRDNLVGIIDSIINQYIEEFK